jgi:hypothetical protein
MIKSLCLFLGTILLLTSFNTSALPATQFIESDTTNQVTIRMSGATAHDAGLLLLLRNTTPGSVICKPNTLDVYISSAKNDALYFCTGGINSGANNKRIAILKESDGGSGVGVGPLVRAQETLNISDGTTITRNWIDPSDATIRASVGVTKPASGAFSAYKEHAGMPATAVTTVGAADVGISDIEPARFTQIYTPVITAAELNALQINGISGVIFGVPVTKSIYQRLQALQFATTSVCHPSNAGYGLITDSTSKASSEECMPSLNKDQVAGMYTGSLTTWSQIRSAINKTETAASVAPYGALTDANIYVQRRFATSGTQRSFEIYFADTGCVVGARKFLDKTNVLVTENSGTNNVISGLNGAEIAGKGSIGILTTEKIPSSSDGWRFVKLNGAAPSLLNVVKGTYDLYFESTIQWRRVPVAGLPAIATDKKGVATAIVNQMGNPAVVSTLDISFSHPFGRAGLVGNAIKNRLNAPTTPFIASGSNPSDTSDVYVRPIASSTRGPNGVPNACLNPAKVNASQVGF